jgi:hypothetical protein
MPRDKQPDHEPDLFDKLFGDPAALADDELNMLYEALSPGTDPSAIVHRIAEEAAVEYRKQNRMPPDHVQATLDATREIRSLDNAKLPILRQIVDAIKAPFVGSVNDPALAYRNRDGVLDKDDQAIMDGLADELRQDWDEDTEDK